MDTDGVAGFAREFLDSIDRFGGVALEPFDWAGGFRALGFEMDCGESLEMRHGIEIHDLEGLRREIGGIENIQVLGNAVFSLCRYATHWATGPSEGDLRNRFFYIPRVLILNGVQQIWVLVERHLQRRCD